MPQSFINIVVNTTEYVLFFVTFKHYIISDMNHSQSFFTDAKFQQQTSNVWGLFFSCRGISFSDPLSASVRMGVESVSLPSKSLMENGVDNNSSVSFKRVGGVVLI